MTFLKSAATAALLATACGTAQAQTQLNVVAPWSSLNAYGAVEQPFWTKDFPAATGGDLTAKLSNYSELGLGGAELLRLASMGVFDVAHIVVGYSVSDDPVIEGIELAGVIQDMDTLRQAVDAYEATMTTDLAEQHNLVYLGMYPNPSQVMYCSEPVTGLDEFAGKKIRFYGSSMNDFIEAAGGTGIGVPLAEVVPALQRGVVDCAFTGTLTGYSFKFPEVTSDLYGLRLGWGLTFIAANKSTFDGLSAEQQDALRSGAKTLEGQLWDLARIDDAAGIACNTGNGECPYGEPAAMSFVPVSEADDARRRDLLEEEILKNWAARCDAACIANWNETVGALTGLTAVK
ncbi:TRAP transporter substrate-binding protein [Pseudooceanicola aestuarii]|uniref:TRAP transporter substrate-binding protein n=1 Tax=Pseudooceanicola aestuarii TaxID=2697319 RepID=UPI0013D2F24F|nr:TRAP transporter substrate-binding protein [Pseudooceanicola aestuarii]